MPGEFHKTCLDFTLKYIVTKFGVTQVNDSCATYKVASTPACTVNVLILAGLGPTPLPPSACR